MNLGFFKRRHELEKKAVLGRLAAVETLAMVDRNVEQSSAQDQALAIARIKLLWGGGIPDRTAQDFLDILLKHLRESKLNINFNAGQFFATKPADKYASKFEVLRTTGAPFNAVRDETEQKMFHYLTISTGSTDKGEKDAVDRMNKLGEYGSADFSGVIRPRYTTLNFGGFKDGGGANWGQSHFVLSDRLKPNMSFVHTDSFNINPGARATPQGVQAQVATYHNMTRLVCNMVDRMLDLLLDSASQSFAAGQYYQAAKDKYRLGDQSYIEGHSHGEILFSRDVDHIRICDAEITGDAAATKNLNEFLGKMKLNKVSF